MNAIAANGSAKSKGTESSDKKGIEIIVAHIVNAKQNVVYFALDAFANNNFKFFSSCLSVFFSKGGKTSDNLISSSMALWHNFQQI